MVRLVTYWRSLVISKHPIAAISHVSAVRAISWELLGVPAFWGFIIPFLAQCLSFYNNRLTTTLSRLRVMRRGRKMRYVFNCALSYTARFFQLFSFYLRTVLTWNIGAALNNYIHGQYTQSFLFRRDVRFSPFHVIRPLHPIKSWLQWRVRLHYQLDKKYDSVWSRRDYLRFFGFPLKPLRQRYVAIG